MPHTTVPSACFIREMCWRIWVQTPKPSTPVANCDQDPQPGNRPVSCWQQHFGYDVFSNDGRYLGPVDLPDELRDTDLGRAYIGDDTVIAQVTDEEGTTRVKRYRLVIPSAEGR